MYLVSACLCGINCRYNGKSSTVHGVIELVKKGKAIPVCPEQIGGLKTPRTPCEIKGEEVLNSNGENYTTEFVKGAREVLELCNRLHIKKAIMKEGSPSCGVDFIYDGSFSGIKKGGMGVTTALLRENGVEVVSELDYLKGEF